MDINTRFRIRVEPRSVEETENLSLHELVRGLATVLAWASVAKVREVRFMPTTRFNLSFLFENGMTSQKCDNVSEVPEDLKHHLIPSVLRSCSRNVLWYWLNRIRLNVGNEIVAEVEVPTLEETSFWKLAFSKDLLLAQKKATIHHEVASRS